MNQPEDGLVIDRATILRGGRTVVAGISLRIAPGQALAVIGRTGSGKSSLMAAIATVLPLQSGDIRIDGRSVRSTADAVRRRIGYVPAGLSAWPHARTDEFLEFFAMQAGLRGKPLRAAVTRALEMAGIAEAATSLGELPAGQAQRLLYARALLNDPFVLVIDAPCTGLDPGERQEIERLIADMHLGGRIVVAAIDDAAVPSCFTHLALLAAGRLIAHATALPQAFQTGRTWMHRIACPGAAGTAAAILRRLGIDARDCDDDTVICRHDPAQGPFSELLAAIGRAGIAVESAGYHPPWPAQLLEQGT